MSKFIKSILFATNFSDNCRKALEASKSLSRKYQCRLVLLHVIEKKVPKLIEQDIKTAMGDDRWEALQKNIQNDARQTLIGKMSPDKLVKQAFQELCDQAQMNDSNCGVPEYETVVARGEVINSILAQAKKQNSSLIVLGAKTAFAKNNSLGLVVKEILRRSKVPVLFVPPFG